MSFIYMNKEIFEQNCEGSLKKNYKIRKGPTRIGLHELPQIFKSEVPRDIDIHISHEDNNSIESKKKHGRNLMDRD